MEGAGPYGGHGFYQAIISKCLVVLMNEEELTVLCMVQFAGFC